ncbi:MAG: DUF2147 domain-containing protein [Sterolibacterium sp.]|jgi:uncharacterized protein (DUF2147 family)|nr:DUF2147 domain-containing protein [Sterolibacterium sp.]
MCTRWRCLILLLGLGLNLPGLAHAEAEVSGIWWSPNKDAKIEMTIDGNGLLSGRLIAMPSRTAADADVKNPAAELKSRRLLGVIIFSGFRQEARNLWVDGKVYDASLGATFSARLQLEDAEHLQVRGYLGLPLFGRTETFTRVSGSEPRRHQTGEPDLTHFVPAK